MSNFRACLELRIGFEVDVQRTKDGHLVCIHDDTVDRTTNGSGRIAALTLAELRSLDAGSWFDPAFSDEQVPTLDEVFERLSRSPHRILVAIDFKAANVEVDTVRLASKHGVLGKLLFIGTTIRTPLVRRMLREAAPEAQIAVVANEPGELSTAMSDRSSNWVYVRYVPSKASVAKIHDEGRRVFIAGPTVAGEEIANWKSAKAAGVDGILTDFPLLLRASLRGK